MHGVRLISPSEDCSLALGMGVGKRVESGDVLALWGELGSGKTLFTRGIAWGMGVSRQMPITSPTFTLINEYEGRLRLYHLDLYRLTTPGELETLPWREILFGNGVTVIEWPDRMGGLLPPERWDVRLEFLDDERRTITLSAVGESRRARIDRLTQELIEIARLHECSL